MSSLHKGCPCTVPQKDAHTNLSVAPQLVALHAVTVVQSDGAVVRDGVEADLPGVHGVAHADVLPPPQRQHLGTAEMSLGSAGN